MSNKSVCRVAPASPGLLKTVKGIQDHILFLQQGKCSISFFDGEKTQCPPPPPLVSAKWSLSSDSGLVVISEL